jgi:hypothetical protein
MTWRVIIRFSLNADQGSVVRNNIARILGDGNIKNTATGTWESSGLPEEEAAKTLADVMKELANAPTLNHGAYLDHLWIYVDRSISTSEAN